MPSFTTADHEAITSAVGLRCASFDDDYWAARDEAHEFPWEFYRSLAADGWVGMAFPEEFGGGGSGITEAAVMMRAIAASGGAMNACTPLHLTIFGLQPVVKHGNDRLKGTFLPRAACGDLHVAFGVTEPDAGTDTSQISTRAEWDGQVWRITGQKIWTSKALEAEVVLLLCRTDTDPADRFGGLTLFLADLDPDYVTIRPIKKLGRNAVATCETFYSGERGQGFRHLLAGLNPERSLLSAEAIGIGEAALNRAVRYAQQRIVFDRPIGANQAISHPLAEAYARLQAAWQMVLVAGQRHDAGLSCAAEANVAKYLAADAGFLAADQAVQTHGGLGYATEYHVERYWREARLLRLAPVSQEMTLNFIAQNVLKLPRSY
jgi:acyl-CoA dehydrogenase